MKIALSLPHVIFRYWKLLIFSFLILSTSYLLLATKPAHAVCTVTGIVSARQSVDAINKCAISANIFDDKIFNLNQIAGTTDSLYNLLTGSSQLHPETNGATAGTGALASSGRLVATLYSAPPASGVQYFAGVLQKFNPVQPVYAQTGTGFQILQPVQSLWTAFRNIAYVGFVIVFVILGFMIMFRARISPQAVATVQDSIPRLVVALILVTFSYAIAGIFIDAMFVLLAVFIAALPDSLLGDPSARFIYEHNVFTLIVKGWNDIFSTVASAIESFIDSAINLPWGLDAAFGFFGGSLLAIVVGIAILFIMFRIFFMLLMTYVTIILLTIFAPFFFLVQALPGFNGAGQWFRQMAANVAVFPVVALMFLFAGMLSGIRDLGGTGTPAIGTGNVEHFPLLSSGLDPSDIGQLIAIGFIFVIPSAADAIKKTLGGGQGPGLGAQAMAGVAAGGAVVGAAGRGAGGAIATQGPIGGWRRAREAKRQEAAQRAGGLRTYTSEYEERKREEDERTPSS